MIRRRIAWQLACIACALAICALRGAVAAWGQQGAYAPPPRAEFIVRLPTAQTDSQGQLIMTPQVERAPSSLPPGLRRPSRVAGDPQAPTDLMLAPSPHETPFSNAAHSGAYEWSAPMTGSPGPMASGAVSTEVYEPDPSQYPPNYQMAPLEDSPVVAPMFEEYQPEPHPWWHLDCEEGLGRILHCFHYKHIKDGDYGFGYERVAVAPFFIEVTQPQQQWRFRIDNYYGLDFPDRAEFFWARPQNFGGRGPVGPELRVDYQDITLDWEQGTDIFSVTTHVPIRVLDPEFNGNTAGLGDIDVSTKLRLMNGERWQITQFFRTYTPSGSVSKGLGTGHISLEPGYLFRYKWNKKTYLHSELRYWFALGGHPIHMGQVLRWGLGLSTVLYESDTYTVIPTLEYVHLAFLDGQQTPLIPPSPVDIDGVTVNYLHTGLRFACDSGGDLGIVEWGVASGFAMGPGDWWDTTLRVELRFAF